jgi:hypothetical protein
VLAPSNRRARFRVFETMHDPRLWVILAILLAAVVISGHIFGLRTKREWLLVWATVVFLFWLLSGFLSVRAAACYDPLLMSLQVLQRPDWHGTPRDVGELFVLKKNRRTARAALFTHQLGWEVRLMVGAQEEIVRTQVCRSQEEVLRTGEEWKKKMADEGWG